MEVDAITLVDWNIIATEQEYFLVGIAMKHEKLGEYIPIKSSGILDFKLISGLDKQTKIQFKTHNSVYMCNIAYMHNGIDSRELISKPRNIGVDNLGEIVRVIALAQYLNYYSNAVGKVDEKHVKSYVNSQKQYEMAKEFALESRKSDDCIKKLESRHTEIILRRIENYSRTLYIDMNSITEGGNAVYTLNSEQAEIKPKIKIDDDIRVCYEHPQFQIEYNVKDELITIDRWLGNIETIIIHNMKYNPIYISNIGKIDIGKETIINKEKIFKKKKM